MGVRQGSNTCLIKTNNTDQPLNKRLGLCMPHWFGKPLVRGATMSRMPSIFRLFAWLALSTMIRGDDWPHFLGPSMDTT